MDAPASPCKNATNSERISDLYIAQARCREHFWIDFQPEMALVGAQLRSLRQRREYRIEWVARFVGIPVYRLHKIESGTYPHLGLREFHNLIHLYGASPAEVLSVIPQGNFRDIAF
jgi:hypothetical protein